MTKQATKNGLPRKSFAYAPTADPATWALPFLTKAGAPDPSALPSSATAVAEAGVPAEFMPMVKSKLRQAYRRWKGSDVEYPDPIRESVYGDISESDGAIAGLTIREATVLLDRSPVSAQVITVPNGDTFVVPCWTGAFDDLGKAYEPYAPNSAWSSAYDAADVSEIIARLLRKKGDEADEPEQAAMIDSAVTALSAFVKAESAEITAQEADGSDETVFEHMLREAGRRNSSKDSKMIQTIHDMTHSLGAEHDMPTRKNFAEAEVDPISPESVITFREATAGEAIVTLAEAGAVFDDEKKQVWITPIAPGFGNQRDNFFYPEDTLREATEAGLFNGVKMFRNHPRKSDEKDLPERSVTDWFGVVKESRWDAAQGRPRALVQVFEESDWNRFKAAPDQVAFSVLGQGKARPGKVGGRDARVIESFTNVRSVDWVTTAGAGGAIEFAESASDEEFEMKIEEMKVEQLEALKESNPEVYNHLMGLASAAAAAAAGLAPDPAVAADPVAATDPTPETPDPKPEPTPEPVAESAAPVELTEAQKRDALLDELIAEKNARVAEAARTTRISEAQVIVKAALKETTLPTVARDAIEEKFSESGFGGGFAYADESGLKAAIEREIGATSKLLTSLKGYAPRATGLGAPASDSPSTTVREAVGERLKAKWGEDVIPAADPTAVWTGKTPEDDSTQVIEKPKAANVSEAAAPVASRLDAKWGNG